MITVIGPNLTNTSHRTSFKGNTEREKEFNNFVNKNIVTPLKNSNKYAHAGLSFIIPGTGQLLQGRNEEGINHLVIKVALVFLTLGLIFKKWLGVPATFANVALGCYSAVDAMNMHKSNQQKTAEPPLNTETN